MSAPGAAAATMAGSPAPSIARGTVHVLFACDLASTIDLDRAALLVDGPAERGAFRERRTPSHLRIEPPPLRFEVAVRPVALRGIETRALAEVTLFDFGGALASFKAEFAGPLLGVVELSEAVYENPELAAAAEEVFRGIVARFAPALVRPQAHFPLEDYAVFQVAAFETPIAPEDLLRDHGATIAAILRAEPGALSAQEIAEALGQSISYRPDDMLVVDWNAAFALDDDFESVEALLGVANVELAELRLLDRLLDDLLEGTYERLPRRTFRDRIGLGRVRQELSRLAALQMDAALLFEQVDNAVKLFGDEYLARVYRLTARRLHVPDWSVSVRRKLETLDRIYSVGSDEQAARRIELLEWIIILLIAWEVLSALLWK
ncbi:MAG TPA: hypothetical protein PKC43_08435 [Phycisphaerales bacterium]|nr:hypothetical protein [Phycisphaerales bacterium]HMP37462.1 hypothetical protein [Phycisphaerales bacterium]